jgi:hypothetical protein
LFRDLPCRPQAVPGREAVIRDAMAGECGAELPFDVLQTSTRLLHSPRQLAGQPERLP